MSTKLPMLTKTNMRPEEVVPDKNTVGHDERYWCLPPMKEDINSVVAVGGGFEFHLVTQGHEVGVWKTWTVAKTMVSGYPNGAHKGHHSYAGCTREWQMHCPLGVHPHPVDPKWKGKTTESKGESVSLTAAFAGAAEPAGTSASRSGPRNSNRRPRRSSSTPGSSSRTSGRLAAVLRGSRAPTARYFAIWGAGIVYSTKYAAKLAFDDAIDDGDEPELLSTDDFEVALAYAEGDSV
ncbi:hypothetical protein B0H13DRAFT_2347947 [Mycena leptocephala]|nr:hypothetical protein B0H13DRAFT_2347947 [Mycena leptocephala]